MESIGLKIGRHIDAVPARKLTSKGRFLYIRRPPSPIPSIHGFPLSEKVCALALSIIEGVSG